MRGLKQCLEEQGGERSRYLIGVISIDLLLFRYLAKEFLGGMNGWGVIKVDIGVSKIWKRGLRDSVLSLTLQGQQCCE